MATVAEDSLLVGTEPARVLAVRRGEVIVTLGAGAPLRATLSGRLLHDRALRPPCVGDFVVVRPPGGDGPGRVERVLEPTTLLQRKASGATSSYQPIAANVDMAVVVCGLPGPEATRHVLQRTLNTRRIERYLLAIQDAGVRPVIAINKADIRTDSEELVAALRSQFGAVDVLLMSAQNGSGVDALERELLPAMSAVLVGTSGVGKSTLINRLLRRDVQRIQPIRSADTRGRHTTTDRELFELPSGALLIDTPGMREFGLAGADDEDHLALFDEIDDLAANCRFRDCRHENEPGCAVIAAIGAGVLSRDRLEHARELEREQQHHRARHEQAARHQEKQAGRRFSRMARERLRDKYGR